MVPALAGGRLADVIIADLPFVHGVTRVGPCVGKVGKFVCIGLNYADHAAESGMPVPNEPDHLHQGDQRGLRAERRRR